MGLTCWSNAALLGAANCCKGKDKYLFIQEIVSPTNNKSEQYSIQLADLLASIGLLGVLNDYCARISIIASSYDGEIAFYVVSEDCNKYWW